MKVTNKVGNSLHGVESTKAGKVSGDAKAGKSNASAGASGLADTAKINLSDRAQSMQRAKDVASNQSVDEAKVGRLQKLIDEGKYNVDSNAVADRMVNEQMLMMDDDV